MLGAGDGREAAVRGDFTEAQADPRLGPLVRRTQYFVQLVVRWIDRGWDILEHETG